MDQIKLDEDLKWKHLPKWIVYKPQKKSHAKEKKKPNKKRVFHFGLYYYKNGSGLCSRNIWTNIGSILEELSPRRQMGQSCPINRFVSIISVVFLYCFPIYSPESFECSPDPSTGFLCLYCLSFTPNIIVFKKKKKNLEPIGTTHLTFTQSQKPIYTFFITQ